MRRASQRNGWVIVTCFGWSATLAIITIGWFVGAIAWLRIDASSPLLPDPSPAARA